MNFLKHTGLVLSLLLICTICHAQKCKYSSKSVKKGNKHFTNEKIVQGTKLKPMFSKFSQAASCYFVKSSENYYLALVLVREFGKRIDILEDNPLIIQFEDNELITLYPDRSLPGKFTLPATTEISKPFYKVTLEQLELLSAQPISYVKIYFSSDKVSEEKVGQDELGTFFDYEILNDNFQSNLMEPAKCIVQ